MYEHSRSRKILDVLSAFRGLFDLLLAKEKRSQRGAVLRHRACLHVHDRSKRFLTSANQLHHTGLWPWCTPVLAYGDGVHDRETTAGTRQLLLEVTTPDCLTT